MKNSFEIALEQLGNNAFDADGVRAMKVCQAADDMLAALKSFEAIGLHLGAEPLLAELCANAYAAIAKATS